MKALTFPKNLLPHHLAGVVFSYAFEITEPNNNNNTSVKMDLSNWTKPSLVEACAEFQLPTSGNKSQLVSRLKKSPIKDSQRYDFNP